MASYHAKRERLEGYTVSVCIFTSYPCLPPTESHFDAMWCSKPVSTTFEGYVSDLRALLAAMHANKFEENTVSPPSFPYPHNLIVSTASR